MLIRTYKAALATGLAIAALIAAQEVARAGEYHVYSCRMPDGEVAPVDGWSGSKTGTYSFTEDTCGQPLGGLVAALGDEPAREANADMATWAFASPAGDTIQVAALWRAEDAAGGGAVNATYESWIAGPGNSTSPADAFSWCVAGQECPFGRGDTSQPFAQGNRQVVPPANLGTKLFVDAACSGEPPYKCPTGKGDPNGYAAAVYLFAADITLEQPEGPHASGVGGELASAATLRGTSSVAFDATDPGAGIWEAVFSLDGQVVQRAVVNEDRGRCRDVGQTQDGLPAFLYLQPCPQSVSAEVPFDSTAVSNGVHRLVVTVLDAAGNGAPVLNRLVTVDNPPPPGAPNGTNATSQAALSVRWRDTAKASVLGGFKHGRALAGRLTTAAGIPIAGARIDLRATPAYAGAKPVAMPSPITDPEGRFSLTIPAGTSSRALRFAYRAHAGDPQPAVARTLRLRTPAAIVLHVTPRTASAGRRIRFRGRLRGAPIPGAGKQLVLEARSPGSGWIEFKVIRTDPRGRFHASYRFKFPGPVDYRFRVRSEAESDFPFAAGVSNLARVHER